MTLWRGGLRDGALAGPAPVTRSADHLHAQLRWDVVEHLGHVFPDRMQRVPATGTGLVLDIDDQLDPRQISRQGAAVASRRRAWRGCRRFQARRGGFQSGLLFRQRLAEVLGPLFHRRVVQLLRPAAEAMALQPGDQLVQPLDLGQCGAQHRLQRRGVVRQGGWSGKHGKTLNRRHESDQVKYWSST